MENCSISIIVPCYNGAEYLRETLDCLQKQTLENWECVIVNDGSTDNSLEIMKEYAAKDKRYKYIDKKNEGPSIARNVAISVSDGKYILPLDSDDLIAPSYVEKAVEYLEKHPSTTLVYCRARYFGDSDEEWLLPEYEYDQLLFANQIFCSCVYRRSDYEKTGGYNTNMKQGLEDWDFLLSLLNRDSEVYRIPEILFYYRKHVVSRTTEANKHTQDLYNRIVANHIDVYYPYLHNTIKGQNEINYYKSELEKILRSNSYRLGKYLLTPLRAIAHIVRK